MAKKFWARRPFQYAGKELDRGQVVELAGQLHDEKLERLGFFAPIEKTTKPVQCGVCQELFISESWRVDHGNLRHPRRFEELTPIEQEARDEKDDQRVAREVPLYLDKTEAARA